MAKAFTLSVVSPDRSVVETDVTSVVAPGVLGYFGVLGDHVPMVSALAAGIVEYIENNDRTHLAIGGGFCEVSDGKVTILADSAHFASEIDLAVEENRLADALKAMRGDESDMTTDQARKVLDEAMAKIRAAKR
ncbi:MAG: ATP synthase F1 subunit epsilon [Fimbriimonadaceae bacterium]|jgi:F-type H+-transporting ATPase subunit epsilon